MNLRTHLRRWRMGADLYDRAVRTCAMQPEVQGKANAEAWLRANGLGHLIRESGGGA